MELDIICGPSLLDGHPLALAVTAPLARTSTSLTQLKRELFTLSRQTEVLAERADSPLQRKLVGKSPWIALEAAYNRLSPTAQSLLCRLSLWTEMLALNEVEFFSGLHPSMMMMTNIKELLDHQLLLKKDNGNYDLHNLVRLYAQYRLRNLPEAKHIYGETGKRLIRSAKNINPNWIAGMTYLADGEQWGELITEFSRHYQILNDSPLSQVEETNPEMLPALARYCLAWVFDEKRRIDEALHQASLVKQALHEVDDSLPKSLVLLRTHIVIANNKLRQSKLKDAGSELELAEGLLQSQPLELYRWEVGQLRLIEGILYRWSGRHQEALAALEEAKSIYETIGDNLQLLKCNSNLATPLCDMGRIDESIRISRDFLAQAADQQYEYTKLRVAEKSNLVDSLTLLGNFDEAIALAEEAIQECEAQGFEGERLALLINIAKAENKAGLLDSAKQHLQSSLKLLVELGYDDYQAEALAVLAENNLYGRNLQEAEQHITEAFKYDELYDQLYGPYRMEALRVKALIALALNDVEGAIATFSESLDGARESNYPYHEARAALHLAEIYSHAGEVASALVHLSVADRYFTESKIPVYLEQARALRAELEAAGT